MNLVKINTYEEGCYRGGDYIETIFLLEEDYNSIGKDFNGEQIILGDSSGNIKVEIITEEEQQSYIFENWKDSDFLYFELDEYTDKLKDFIERENKYISNIDSIVNVTFQVKKSQVENLKNVVNELLK